MKKLLALLLALSLIMCCVFALSACTGSDDDNKDDNNNTDTAKNPDKDSAKALDNLIKKGYEARILTSSDLEEYFGISTHDFEDLENAVYAFNDDGYGVLILYFPDSAALKKAESSIDTFFGNLKTGAADEGFDFVIEKSDRMAWVGDEASIKIAAGMDVEAPGSGSSSGSGSGSENSGGAAVEPNAPDGIPMRNYFDAKNQLVDLNYAVTLFCVDHGDDFSSFNMEGIQAYIVAIHPESGDWIEIYYFETAEDANNSYDKINEYFEESRDEHLEIGKEFNFIIGNYDNMIWTGTEETIRDSSGK